MLGLVFSLPFSSPQTHHLRLAFHNAMFLYQDTMKRRASVEERRFFSNLADGGGKRGLSGS